MAVLEADVPKLAKASAAIYRQWKPLIDRYHAGAPAAAIAVRMKVESGGKMDLTPGGGSLQEIGLLSVTRNQEVRFGVPDGTRKTPEGNVFLFSARVNVDTQLFRLRYPGLFPSVADQHIAGQLVAGIGVGAASYLFDRVQPRAGITYRHFERWVADEAKAGKLPQVGPWGSQSLETIVYRVAAFRRMDDAARLMARDYGVPYRPAEPYVPPLPPGLASFKLPREIVGKIPLTAPVPRVLWMIAGAAAVVAAWWAWT